VVDGQQPGRRQVHEAILTTPHQRDGIRVYVTPRENLIAAHSAMVSMVAPPGAPGYDTWKLITTFIDETISQAEKHPSVLGMPSKSVMSNTLAQ
jgi:hypothetical protein